MDVPESALQLIRGSREWFTVTLHDFMLLSLQVDLPVEVPQFHLTRCCEPSRKRGRQQRRGESDEGDDHLGSHG